MSAIEGQSTNFFAQLEKKRRKPRIKTGRDKQRGDADLHYKHSYIHIQKKHPSPSAEAGNLLTSYPFTFGHTIHPYSQGIESGLREARKGIKDGVRGGKGKHSSHKLPNIIKSYDRKSESKGLSKNTRADLRGLTVR